VKDREPNDTFAGIDWASKTHAVCVIDKHGAVRARFEVPSTGKSFTALVRRLARLNAQVATERGDGPLVEALLDAGCKVVVITPRQVNGLRSRYSATGAKSDATDAYLLADVLRTDGHHLRALSCDSDATRVLRSLSRTGKQLVEARVGPVNQLRAEPERVFPGAVGLLARLDCDTAIAFLRRISYCGRTPVPDLFARLQDAPAAGPRTGEAEGRAVAVPAMPTAIEAVRGQERELAAEIVERLDTHTDAHIFTSLPKAARGVRAAALLAEIGDDRARFPDEQSLAAHAGVAPVTKTSGQYTHVGPRRAADKKLRNALIDFADDSRHASPWAAKIYADATARGKPHPHAVRILTRAGLRVIRRCRQDRAAYDPTPHEGAIRLAAA
jgi:transposase